MIKRQCALNAPMYSVQCWQLPTGFFGTAGGIVAT